MSAVLEAPPAADSAAPREITFMIINHNGHDEEKFDPEAAAHRFDEFRASGAAMFNANDPDEHVLLSGDSARQEALPEKILVVSAYAGG